MVFKVNDRLPEDCALRRGTLIAGVPKRSPSGKVSEEADPMQGAEDQIEQFLEAKHAEANRDPLQDDPNRPETEADAIRAAAIRRLGVRRMVEKAVSKK